MKLPEFINSANDAVQTKCKNSGRKSHETLENMINDSMIIDDHRKILFKKGGL